MKKRILVLSGVLSLFLGVTGCSGTEDVKTTKATNEQVKLEKLTEKEYLNRISDLAEKFNGTFEQISEILNSEVTDSRNDDLLSVLDETKGYIKEFKSLAPPKEMSEIQDSVLKAMKEYDKMVISRKKSIENKSSTLWEVSNEYQKKGDKHWQKLGELLQGYSDKMPIGDGTITAEDLKNLDKSAGIDRDSVKKNISSNGKELSGNWGYEGDGVNIILHKDGTYESYKIGEYPSKDNYQSGTWAYDNKQHLLVVTNKENYREGAPVADFRQNMKFDIQYFADDTMQLLDIESFNTYRYVKVDLPNSNSNESSFEGDNSNSTKDIVGNWSVSMGSETVKINFKSDNSYVKVIESSENMTIEGTYTCNNNNTITLIEKKKNGKDLGMTDIENYKIESVNSNTLTLTVDGNTYDFRKE